MGLVKCFEAESYFEYDLYPRPSSLFGGVEYHTYLKTPPRTHCEEHAAVGTVWTECDPNRWGKTSISHLANLNQVEWPSWNVSRWRVDGTYGRKYVDLDGNTSYRNREGYSVVWDKFSWEPRGNGGRLWWYGAHADAYHGGPVPLVSGAGVTSADPAVGMALSAQVDQAINLVSGWGLRGGATCFAMDADNERMFAQWDGANIGEVKVFRYPRDGSFDPDVHYLGSIFTPGHTVGTFLSTDGFAYVHDSLGWICVYDYNARFYGALRDVTKIADSPWKGTCWGWDPFFKRLLRVRVTAPAVNGASTVRAEGFYPIIKEAYLSPPIPRSVPRVGRKTYFVSHVLGESRAEPIIGRRLKATIDGQVRYAATDQHGDAAFGFDLATPGGAQITVDSVEN